ncbi:hypothetical protein [Undibacterium sp. TS12]|uniref:hypothetical protein n=1 Tax=Undibacterium sp. TS12 TaxID=2908202 RepID=UPI001F4D241B|nr:hypothetical protein [Undibacterium sp. TS12]MCH8622471.1 hypothetical protein [Undibacterium sp. TS12]
MPIQRLVRSKPLQIAVAVSLLFSLPASAAQSDKERIAELEKKLERSLAVIDKLSQRVDQLEAQKAIVAKVSESDAETRAKMSESVKQATEVSQQQVARIDQLEKNLVQVSELSAKKRELGLPLHGFADVGYVHSSKVIDGRKSGFALGNLDFYLTPEFGDRIKSLFELTFEFNEKGDAVGTDLERLQIGYTFNDALTLWAGRVHTPYGYWNTAFHHGAQLQPSISRPKMIAFEDQGGILPAHSVGLMASGATKLQGGRLEYDVVLANGSRIVGEPGEQILDYNAGKDDNSNKGFGGNVRYRFSGNLDGLTVGAHALTQQINQEGTENKTELNMLGGFVVFDNDDWELIGEYYKFRNKDLSGNTGTHNSWTGFLHAGYRFNDLIQPYARLEKASLDQSDNYFAALKSGRSYNRQILGLRYNLSPISALKFELGQTNEKQVNGADFKYNETRVQFAVRF